MKYLVFVFWGVSVEEVVGFERDHRVREVEQVGSACQPNFVHYCALAASPLLSCNVYAPVFRKKNCAYCICTYTGGPKNKAAGAMVPSLICQQPVLPDLEENIPRIAFLGRFLTKTKQDQK